MANLMTKGSDGRILETFLQKEILKLLKRPSDGSMGLQSLGHLVTKAGLNAPFLLCGL